MRPLTPSQTVGPYLRLALDWPDGPAAVTDGNPGAFWLRGRVFDGAGDAVPDALVETWQAGAAGRGFGRCPTGADGEWGVRTTKPPPLPAADGPEAPHIDVSLFARGLLDRLVTRIYFIDEAELNSADPVLRALPEARRGTLLAAVTDDGYVFDIHLQGDDETVFFAL